MRPNWVMRAGIVAGFVFGLWLAGAPGFAQTQSSQQTPPPPATPPQTATSTATSPKQSAKPAEQTPQSKQEVERIRRALAVTPTLDLDQQQLRFYMEVYARQPRFQDLVGAFDLKNGPVPRAGMTHQEFLNQVTPKELYASSGGITASEALQWAVVNWAAQAIIKRGLEDMRKARTDAEIQAIRARIDKELAALGGK